jgi:hypothetical protein
LRLSNKKLKTATVKSRLLEKRFKMPTIVAK